MSNFIKQDLENQESMQVMVILDTCSAKKYAVMNYTIL